MDLDLRGKTALVTGSSRGIGLVIAETLAREGCRVALNGQDGASVSAAATTIPAAVAVAGDVTRPEDARRVVATAEAAMGRLDILVCNVGSGRSVPPGAETHEEWLRVLALNLSSATNMVEAARDALMAARGSIVCVSSICGHEVVPGAPITYSAAKASLDAYVRGMARPLGAVGIRINAVVPGNIVFDGSVWSERLAADAPAVQQMLDREVALKTLGEPPDVANIVAYLASPLARFVTGASWIVDGGQVRG